MPLAPPLQHVIHSGALEEFQWPMVLRKPTQPPERPTKSIERLSEALTQSLLPNSLSASLMKLGKVIV